MAERAQILVKGIVQGVGFRPFVFNLAESLKLTGYVMNTADGVVIEVEGRSIPEFIDRLPREAPPLAHITAVSSSSLPAAGYPDFTIRTSVNNDDRLPFTLVSPDVSVCNDCLRELLTPTDRRHLYPFINCTNCGPRYSITRSVPYDRPNTTMKPFTMCAECTAEYNDPRDRRFHAQPNACPACGPRLEFKVRGSDSPVRDNQAMTKTISLLKQGGIVAIKGIGGFHIACDAENEGAVRRLRERKRRSNKPFAVMAASLEEVRRFCFLSPAEEDLLLLNRRPIVLLHKRRDQALAGEVSPNNVYTGCMLPYTPLHHLLFYFPVGPESSPGIPNFSALVMTSGNLSEEPIVHTNEGALQKLSFLVDGFLLHDRDIFMRVDDSVIRTSNYGLHKTEFPQTIEPADKDVSMRAAIPTPITQISFIRRSRGYAPDPILLNDDGPEVLGCGADLKNTFTFTKGSVAVVSQHIGDMENYETLKFFEESLENMRTVYRADPRIVVHDLHPGYLSTRWAMNYGLPVKDCDLEKDHSGIPDQQSQVVRVPVQHHYAHIGSVMAEHGLNRGKVIGVAFDGTGYGSDGNLWGGEFLVADIQGFERIGQFHSIALPGGETAIREPWRTAVSHVLGAFGEQAWDCLETIGFVRKYGRDLLENVMKVTRSPELSPLASSAGRLFDAVSALLGVCDTNTFEGEAAVALESLTRPGCDEQYGVEFMEKNGYTVVVFHRTVMDVINDICSGAEKEYISSKFHNTVSMVIQAMIEKISRQTGIVDVALSGGTFQNQYLLNRTMDNLSSTKMNVFVNEKVPCNDGGISLGQAYLVRERLKGRSGIPHSGSRI